MSEFLIIDHFKSQPDIVHHEIITNNSHLPINASHKKIDHSHKQNVENSSLDDLVQEPPQQGGGKLYTVNGNIKFRTKDKNPEKIAAQLVAPSKKNCDFLISMGKKGRLFKCVQKKGKVCKDTPLYKKK